MKKFKAFVHRVRMTRGLKYLVVSLLAILLIGFVDENSLLRHLHNRQRISMLESEIKRYNDIYKHDQAQIHMLDSDPNAIRKIARERYFMKADDEDIFVLSDDPENQYTLDDDETAE